MGRRLKGRKSTIWQKKRDSCFLSKKLRLGGGMEKEEEWTESSSPKMEKK